MNGGFDFEIDRIVNSITSGGHEKVILQFPEGLKRKAVEVIEELSSRLDDHITIMVSGEPCFGACDLPDHPDALIVNFGHYPIPNLDEDGETLFIPARSMTDPIPIVDEAISLLKGRVGLIFTPQYMHRKEEVKDHLTSKGIEAIIGKGGDRLFMEGQVLGCNTSAAGAIAQDVDMLLFVGAGNFHPLALALGTRKDVLIADPDLNEIREIADLKDRVLRQRHATITRARDAKVFGIILSTKPGQRRERLAIQISRSLSEAGKASTIIELENVSPPLLDAFKVDAWVSTACPRLAIDDHLAYSVPILTPPELDILLGKRDWEDYVFDEIE